MERAAPGCIAHVKTLFVCDYVHCRGRGSLEFADKLRVLLDEHGAGRAIPIAFYRCFGGCDRAPNVIVHPEGRWYCHVEESDLEAIAAHLCGLGPPVSRLEDAPPWLHTWLRQDVVRRAFESCAAAAAQRQVD